MSIGDDKVTFKLIDYVKSPMLEQTCCGMDILEETALCELSQMLCADPLEVALTIDVFPGIVAEVDTCIIDSEGPQVEKGKRSVVMENVHSTYALEVTCPTASQSGSLIRKKMFDDGGIHCQATPI